MLVAVCLNKYSFCLHVQPPPFCIETNLRKNRFFAADGRLVRKKGTHNVKIYTEIMTF